MPGHGRIPRRSPARAALGVGLALTALYALTSAGRIDIIDGQIRYEVARNWLDAGRPEVRDPAMARSWLVFRTATGTFGAYNAGASVTAMPLMLLSRALPGHNPERDRFAFALAGPVFGGAGGALLLVALGLLGLPARQAMTWAAVAGLATFWWPASTTVFDQNQHGVLLLASVLLAWQSGRQGSLALAALGGLVGGLLVNFQENYGLLLPVAALAVFAGPAEGAADRAPLPGAIPRRAVWRWLAFVAATGAGLLGLVAFNLVRFGTAYHAGRFEHPLLFSGDVGAALASLAVSPGKGVLWFSPPLALAGLGAAGLFRRAPVLAFTVAAVSVIHVVLVAQMPFFGGDWAWGPRYLVPLLPLWALAMPWGWARLRRPLGAFLVGTGFLVQLLGISLDHQRFFFEHNLPPFFWLDQWAYFKRSQLLARPAELASTLANGVPAEARHFSPTPGWQSTYTPAGPRDYARDGQTWVRLFSVFHLPRPWPFWLGAVEPSRRPVDGPGFGLALGALLLAGVGLCGLGAIRAPATPAGSPAGLPRPDPIPSPARKDRQPLGPRLATWGLVLAGGVWLLALWVGGLPYQSYQVLYGRFGWGPWETAFLVNYLLLGTAAVGCLGLAAARAWGPGLVALFDRLGGLSPRAAAAVAAAGLAVLAALITAVRLYLYRDSAITDDENVYAFMAKVFAQGRLWVPSPPPPIRRFFDNQFIVNDGKWYGMFFPGHGALLALGEAVGAMQWVPTLSALVTALLGWRIAVRLFGPRAAVLTLVLLPLSPYVVASSATLLAHSTAALFLALFVYGCLRTREPGASPLWWLLAGLALGWAGHTRPLAAASFALPWLAWLALGLRRDPRPRRLVGAALLGLAGLLAVGAFFAYNRALSGNPFSTGYHTYSRLYGFPVAIGALQAPMPLPVVYEVTYTLERLNFWLFGWPLSLGLLPFFRRTAESLTLAAAALAVILAYGVSTLPTINAAGPAHYAELAVFLVVLSAGGLDHAVERLREWSLHGARLALGGVLASVACAALGFAPVHAGSLRLMSGVARAPYDLVERQGLDRAVVFVHSLPALHVSPGAWVYYHRNPSPDLGDRVLFVRYLGEAENRVLMRALPDRTPYAMGLREGRLVLVPLSP